MNGKQKAQVRMFTVVALFFTKYMDVLKTFIVLLDEMTNFTNKNKELKIYLGEQDLGVGGVKDDKETLKHKMIDNIMPLAKLAWNWAKKNSNSVMMTLFKVSETDFEGSEENAITLANNIIAGFDKISAADAIKYHITPLKVTDATTSIANFAVEVGTPEQQKIVVKDATVNIDKCIKEIGVILVSCDNFIDGEFWTNTDLRNEYHFSRRVGSSVIQHTALKVQVYGDKEHTLPIAGAMIGIDSLMRSEQTNELGEGEIVQFTAGTYQLSVKATGYGDADVPFAVKRGKHTELIVVLVPNTIEVYMTDFKGLPTNEGSVSIVDTTISGVTNDLGYNCLTGVPEGSGTVEGSDINGNFAKKSFEMGNGKRLRIDLKLE